MVKIIQDFSEIVPDFLKIIQDFFKIVLDFYPRPALRLYGVCSKFTSLQDLVAPLLGYDFL